MPSNTGSAYQFTNTTRIGSPANSSEFATGSSDFSVMMWLATSGIYRPSTDFTSPLANITEPGSGIWQIAIKSGGQVSFLAKDNNLGSSFNDNLSLVTTGSVTSANANVWHHIALRRSGTYWSLTKDSTDIISGNDLGSTISTSSITILSSGLSINSVPSGLNAGQQKNIKIDDLRFYNYFVPNGSLSEIYNSGIGSEYASGTAASSDVYFMDYTRDISGTYAISNGSSVIGSKLINNVNVLDYSNLYTGSMVLIGSVIIGSQSLLGSIMYNYDYDYNGSIFTDTYTNQYAHYYSGNGILGSATGSFNNPPHALGDFRGSPNLIYSGGYL